MSDRQEIIGLIDEFYRIISGKTDEERDWESFKKLFSQDAKLKPVAGLNEGTAGYKDINSYISSVGKFLKKNDFYEFGLNYRVNIFKNIANVYSEYEAKKSKEDNKIIKRGVNFVHLYNDGGGWKISSMLWQDE